jgi:hypothetical protein
VIIPAAFCRAHTFAVIVSNGTLSFLHRYGEASSTDAILLGATDLLQNGGANVYVRNYLVCRMLLFWWLFLLINSLPILAALTCNNAFEGGGWALVRRVKKGSTWFAASDNLRGTASYGIRNSRVNDDSSFSIPYSPNVWLGTEFLFMIGKKTWSLALILACLCARCA